MIAYSVESPADWYSLSVLTSVGWPMMTCPPRRGPSAVAGAATPGPSRRHPVATAVNATVAVTINHEDGLISAPCFIVRE
jgi:hypothetical protein